MEEPFSCGTMVIARQQKTFPVFVFLNVVKEILFPRHPLVSFLYATSVLLYVIGSDCCETFNKNFRGAWFWSYFVENIMSKFAHLLACSWSELSCEKFKKRQPFGTNSESEIEYIKNLFKYKEENSMKVISIITYSDIHRKK